jgi:hypothetical protein
MQTELQISISAREQLGAALGMKAGPVPSSPEAPMEVGGTECPGLSLGRLGFCQLGNSIPVAGSQLGDRAMAS